METYSVAAAPPDRLQSSALVPPPILLAAPRSDCRRARANLVFLLLASAFAAAAQDKPADAIRKQLAAAQIQREAVRKQAELAAQYRLGPTIEPLSDCDPLPPAEITPIVTAAAQIHQIQTALLRGVMEQESGGRPCAVSSKGARGLMQLMPATIEQFRVEDAFDPKQNVEAGAQYLKQLLDKYKGNLSLALAAFNSGPATVDKANGIPDIKETRDYVDAILKKLKSDSPKPPEPPN